MTPIEPYQASLEPHLGTKEAHFGSHWARFGLHFGLHLKFIYVHLHASTCTIILASTCMSLQLHACTCMSAWALLAFIEAPFELHRVLSWQSTYAIFCLLLFGVLATLTKAGVASYLVFVS